MRLFSKWKYENENLIQISKKYFCHFGHRRLKKIIGVHYANKTKY